MVEVSSLLAEEEHQSELSWEDFQTLLQPNLELLHSREHSLQATWMVKILRNSLWVKLLELDPAKTQPNKLLLVLVYHMRSQQQQLTKYAHQV
jgi:hypothetical protein